MKKPDLTKYKTTSTLYLLILIIAAVALVFGWQCTSYSLSNHSADLHIQMLPSRRVKVSKATTVYRISDVRWTKKASTLMFYSQHHRGCGSRREAALYAQPQNGQYSAYNRT